MDIKDIKKQLSITQVLAHYGISAIKNKQICCPFHEDKTPSMQVYEDKGLVYCHSTNCPQGGKHLDGIEIFALMDKTDKHKAILKAKEFIGQQATTPIKSIPRTMPTENLSEIPALSFAEVFPKLQQSFIKSDKAQAYAKARNINHAKINIGFNALNSTVYKGLKNRIVFPLKDESGIITSLYGRSISESDNAKHYYSANRKGLYHNATKETKQIILTESIIDSATIQVHTNHETLALFGTNGFNEEHETLLKSVQNLQEIILFFDGDEAGRKAITNCQLRITELLPSIKISAVNTPENEDINSLVQSHEPEILNHLIQERQILFSSPEEKSDTLEVPPLGARGLDTKNEEYLSYEYENLLFSIIGGVALFPIDKLKITLGIQIKQSKNPLHKIRQSNLDLCPC